MSCTKLFHRKTGRNLQSSSAVRSNSLSCALAAGLVAYVVMLAACTQASDVTVFLSPIGHDTLHCGSAALPCQTFTAAVDVANAVPSNLSVTIEAAGGCYNATSCNVTLLRPAAVFGAGSALTVVDCEHRVFFMSTNFTLTFAGITVTNAVSTIASGALYVHLFISSSVVVVRDAVFVNNSATTGGYAGAVSIRGTNNTSQDDYFIRIENCKFLGSLAAAGVALVLLLRLLCNTCDAATLTCRARRRWLVRRFPRVLHE